MPVAGEIVIAEIMYNPPAATGVAAQWIEIRNLVSSARSLTGCIVITPLDSWNITVPATISAMGDLVLAKDANLAAAVTLASPPVASALFPVMVSSGTAYIVIECGATLVFSVTYSAFWGDPLVSLRNVEPGTAQEGRSLVLSSGAMSTADATDPNNWGRGSAQYAAGLRGTPGTANANFCVADTCISLGYGCGTGADGCGGGINCGGCAGTCNATTHQCE